jgi:peptide/nickel transport system substrate-binding protein
MLREKLFTILALSAILALSMIVVACVPAPAVVEKVVKETVIVEKEVEVVVTPTPEPPPVKTGGAVNMQIGISHLSYSNPWESVYWKAEMFDHLYWPRLAYTCQDDLPDLELAEGYEVSPDAMVHTFTLPEEAKWTDGEPITAEDVAFTYKMCLTPEVLCRHQSDFKGIKGAQDFIDGKTDDVSGIKVVDDHTIQFEREEPDTMFLMKTTGQSIAPKHVWEEIPIAEIADHTASEMWQPTVTGGPFKFVRYEEAQYIELDRWDDYWGEPAEVDKIFGKHVDWATYIAQLEAAELDLSYILNPADASRLEEMPHIVVMRNPGAQVTGLKMNLRKPYLQDKRVRQALAYALDWEAIAEAAAGGRAQPTYSPFLGPEWAVNPDLNQYDYDPEKAKSMLEEVGWDFDQELEFMVLTGMGPWIDAAQVIQAQLAEIGVKVTLKVVSGAARTPTWDKGDLDFEYWNGGFWRSDPATVESWYKCGGQEAAQIDYCNPRLDELFQMGVATPDVDERQKIYFEAAEILNDELPMIWLFSPDMLIGVNAGLDDVAQVHIKNITCSAAEWNWK